MPPLLIPALFISGCMDYGVSRRYFSDSFVQPSRESGVDILWVVDNSASMFEEQDQLAAHADSFIGYLSRAPVDFLMGIASTDLSIDEPGVLVGEVLTSETPHLADEFADLIYMDEGSRDEKGFYAALEAVDQSGPNGGIFRPDSDLEVIFFTDEDDQSDFQSSDFLEGLYSHRTGGVIAVNAIVGDPPEGCASVFGAADAGIKYQEAQEASEGLRESICSLDYDAMLGRIALKVLGLNDRIYLSAPPDLGTIEVRIDDVLMHRRERHGWRYDAGDNCIIFDGYAVPYPGSEVIVRYGEWIGPTEELMEEDDASEDGEE
jgi:hypothetical protein